MNDRMTPEDAVRVLADQVNADIARTVRDSEKVRAKYEEYTALQERIDEARAAGRKVPAAWIKNPFHLRWYAFNGWLEDAEQK
jgi:multiple sugar transport system substrate-binding protein